MKGYSLMELMITLVIASLLLAVAIPAYNGYAERARYKAAIGGVGAIHIEAERFYLSHNRFPTSIDELGLRVVAIDPWGNNYVFHPFTTNGDARKDHNSVPVNGPYDIYSKGPDGVSATPLTSTGGRDDVVMARDGAYIGIAKDY